MKRAKWHWQRQYSRLSIVSFFLIQQEDSTEIIVCHANVIRYFAMRALQLPPEAWLRISLKNGSITLLSISPRGKVSLRALGDAGHMPPECLTTTWFPLNDDTASDFFFVYPICTKTSLPHYCRIARNLDQRVNCHWPAAIQSSNAVNVTSLFCAIFTLT